MNPFFGRTLVQTQQEVIRQRDALFERSGRTSSRAQVRSKRIPGFNEPDSSNAQQPQVNQTQPKTNYIPYVVGGLALLYFVTR